MFTYSLTFGDQAENNVGMEKIGKSSLEGIKDFNQCIELIGESNIDIINLDEKLPSNLLDEFGPFNAQLLIIRNGVDLILGKGFADKMLEEQRNLPFDKKAKMRGRVVNKRARWNSCFSDFSQEPDYEKGKGTVIDFKDVPILSSLRDKLPLYFGEKTNKLQAEMNYYYDINKCGIGYHGDSERKIVICARLGAPMPLCYHWYYQSKRVGTKVTLTLNHGDIYAMTEKAVGSDWKRRKIPTLRHAAGCNKYIK